MGAIALWEQAGSEAGHQLDTTLNLWQRAARNVQWHGQFVYHESGYLESVALLQPKLQLCHTEDGHGGTETPKYAQRRVRLDLS